MTSVQPGGPRPSTGAEVGGGPSRRAVLRVTLLAGTAALVGGAGLALQPGRPRAPRRPLVCLSPRSFAVLAAVADRFCPGAPGLPSAAQLGVAEKIDQTLDRLHPGTAADLHRALLLLENGLVGLMLGSRPIAFTALAPDAQDRALAAWRDSRFATLRAAHKALLAVVSAAYWSDPATFPFVGYPGPPRFPDPAP